MIKDRDGNILCQKIGTKKTHHLNPLLARNPELMKERGWAIVETPQAPPKINGEYKQPETVSTTVDQPAEYKNNFPNEETLKIGELISEDEVKVKNKGGRPKGSKNKKNKK